MDVAAYGLSRNPFERNSELDEACLPNPLAVQLSELQAGLRSPQGVSVLVGERGSGKSLLAKIFARRLVPLWRTFSRNVLRNSAVKMSRRVTKAGCFTSWAFSSNAGPVRVRSPRW